VRDADRMPHSDWGGGANKIVGAEA